MKIKSLKLHQFRNYEDLYLEFDDGTNLFYGENAQGKTNILEAVYLSGTTKSHRSAKDRDIIMQGCDEAHIRMNMEIPSGLTSVDMHLKKAGKKDIAIDLVPVKRAADLISLGNFVFFSPEDLSIIKSGPAARRRFMDMELCQTSPFYIHALARYNHVLMQRGKLLKDITSHAGYEDMLDVWDEQLVKYGREVIAARKKFILNTSETAGKIHGELSGNREEIQIEYDCSAGEDEFSEKLKESRERDIRYKVTNVGPHRDDMIIKVNGLDLKSFGSQGQQRTAALSLKMAEIELLKKAKDDTPVLLLDDVLSELDRKRQRYLLESIEDVQTFITGTGLEIFKENNFPVSRIYQVSAGKVF